MRVLLDVSAVPDQPTGAGVYILELTRALAAAGTVDLHLLSRRGDTARWAQVAPGVPVYPHVPAARPLRLAWEQAAAPALARQLGIDVVHGPHYTLPLRVRARRVVTVHDTTFFDHPELHERAKVAYFRRIIRAAVRRADVVVAVSPETADAVRALLRPRGEVVLAPHGVDHRLFTPRTPEVEESDRSALATVGVRPPYLAFVGTLEPRKRVPLLVRAFACLASTHPELSLVLAGPPGWGAREVAEAVEASGVAHRVVRLGYVERTLLPALYRQAACVVYPSLAEGFGLPVLEALASGAAVVTTAGTVMAGVAAGAAVLVPGGDEATLAAAVERVLTDASLARRLREAGPAVAARYSWEACARTHLEAYAAAAARVA